MIAVRKLALLSAVLAALLALAGSAEQNPELPPAELDTFLFATKNRGAYSPVFLGNGYLSVATNWNGTVAGSHNHCRPL